MIYDKTTAHDPNEEDDYQYQGKRRDEYSDKATGYILIAIVIVLIFLIWEISLL